jgi:hypothetical protein
MATSIVPSLIDALVGAAATALPSVLVTDGYDITDNPGPDKLMVGVDDGTASTAASSSNASQEQATAGTPRSRQQTGSLNCWALSWNGDATAKTARDAVYAIQAGVENILRADPTLGIPRPNGQVLVIQLGDEQFSQDQTDTGAMALLTFTVQFEARI